MDNVNLALRAVSFAARKHNAQLRKDRQTPYVAHPFRVALIMSNVFGIKDDAVITAAILHDAIEDTATDFDDIENEFSLQTAKLVSFLTKDKSKRRSERDEDYFKKLKESPDGVKLIKLADIYDNLADSPSSNSLEHYLKTTKKAKKYIELFKDTKNQQITSAIEKIKNLLSEEVFVALIIDWNNDRYESYIVNPTDKYYKRVVGYTGAFCGDDDGLIETSRAVKEFGELKPYSAIPVESSDTEAFDFVIWYHLDLYPKNGTEKVGLFAFHFPKYALAYDQAKQLLPIINRVGQKIKLEERTELNGQKPLTIDEMLKNK